MSAPARRGLVSPVDAALDEVSIAVREVATRGTDRQGHGRTPSAARTPVEFEAEATAKISKLERALSVLGCNSAAGNGLQSLIDRTLTQTGFGHPGHRYNDCRQFSVRAAKRLEKAKETGLARLEELRSTRPPMDVDSGSARVLQIKALVLEMRQERDDLRAGGAVTKRGKSSLPSPKDHARTCRSKSCCIGLRCVGDGFVRPKRRRWFALGPRQGEMWFWSCPMTLRTQAFFCADKSRTFPDTGGQL